MRIFLALMKKELLLLWRDRLGLLVLFLMPMLLLLVISSVQGANFKTAKDHKLRILLINNSGEKVSDLLASTAQSVKNLDFISKVDGKNFTSKEAKRWLLEGRYHMLLLVPKGAFHAIKQAAVTRVKTGKITHPKEHLQLWLDPAMNPAYANLVKIMLQQFLHQVQVKAIYHALQKRAGTNAPAQGAKEPNWLQAQDVKSPAGYLPSPVQNNVPAWSLFGMFFIVIPLSAALLQERRSNVMLRLLSTPASLTSFVTSKVIAYVLVNLVQLALMFAVGIYLFPYFGLQQLHVMPQSLSLLALIGLCSALAATGFGVLVGSVARSFQQAAMLGPVLIVIAAAIGGVMLPAYLMPAVMQNISIFSPLNWGLRAFVAVLIRGQGLQVVLPYLGYLFIFFLLTTGLSILALQVARRRQV